MAVTGILALILAMASAVWLLVRMSARTDTGINGRINVLKITAWLGLAAALFLAKLAPAAVMILIAAGGITAIEMWRERRMDNQGVDDVLADQSAEGELPVWAAGSLEEAASILGVDLNADEATIRNAYRRLIIQLHPDRGGNEYLAAKINSARDTMLNHASQGEKGQP